MGSNYVLQEEVHGRRSLALNPKEPRANATCIAFTGFLAGQVVSKCGINNNIEY